MSKFDFDITAGSTHVNNGFGTSLAANTIHDVIFDGVEARDFKSKDDPSKEFHVLDIKFSNADGTFTHTIWEPSDDNGDFDDREGLYTSPSVYKEIMLVLKHLIDAVNPSLGKAIDAKEKSLSTSSWNALRDLIVDVTKESIGCKTKIKLVKNNKGLAVFPSFVAGYSKTGNLYLKTNFIGNNVFWTNKELEKMKNEKTATPTPVDDIKKDTPQKERPEFDDELPF